MLISRVLVTATLLAFTSLSEVAHAQLIDRTLAPNAAGEGIAKSLVDQAGVGRGSDTTPASSIFIIDRDPFRAIRRGRQLFQRKFTRNQGQGPVTGDGAGDINTNLAIGAGLVDSCAGCHGRPRGTAGAGGNVVTRPDSRDAPHLFGLGLKEMLADDWRDVNRQMLGMLIYEREFLLAIMNAGPTPVPFRMPRDVTAGDWQLLLDSSGAMSQGPEQELRVPPRTLCLWKCVNS